MTHDEIRKLEAGRELDALIAEHVMGWHWIRGREAHVEDKTVYRWLHAPGIMNWFPPADGTEPLTNGSTYATPHYSTNIIAALEVILEVDKEITLFRNLWGNGVWHWHCHIDTPIEDPGEHWAEVESLAHAICLAALSYSTDKK